MLCLFCSVVLVTADTLTDPSDTFRIDNGTQNTITGVVIGDPYALTTDNATLSGVLVDPTTGQPPLTGSPASNYKFIPGTGPLTAVNTTTPVVTPVVVTPSGGGGGGGGGASAYSCIINASPKTLTLGQPTLLSVTANISVTNFTINGVSYTFGSTVKVSPITTTQYTAYISSLGNTLQCSVVVSVVSSTGTLIGDLQKPSINSSDLTNGVSADMFSQCKVIPFTKKLKRGSIGSEVLRAEKFLQSQGYDVPAIGFFGPKMEIAVKQFQKLYWNDIVGASKSKVPTGLWYDYTIKKANSLLRCSNTQRAFDKKPDTTKKTISTVAQCKPFIKPLKRGAIGTEVYRVQKFLQSQGFDTPAVGVFGPRMETAVKQFQELYADAILKPTNATIPTGLWLEFSMKKANELTGCVYQR